MKKTKAEVLRGLRVLTGTAAPRKVGPQQAKPDQKKILEMKRRGAGNAKPKG